MARSGWRAISSEDYGSYFERFGGSFHVHPTVTKLLEKLSGRRIEYKAFFRDSAALAAVPLWGRYIVATNHAFSAYDHHGLIDVGMTEVVLPVDETALIHAPFVVEQLSAVHAKNFANLKPTPQMMLAKGLRTGAIQRSARSQKTELQRLRQFESAGGHARQISEFAAAELAGIYADLHQKRWGYLPYGHEYLDMAFSEFRSLLAGHVLLMERQPVAIQVVYNIETPRWILADFVNGGTDREAKGHSLGGLLTFLNLRALEDEAIAKNKPLRMSFGNKDMEYKALWAYEVPSYQLDLPPLHPVILKRRLARRVNRLGDRFGRIFQ
jgi:hypothetical protein